MSEVRRQMPENKGQMTEDSESETVYRKRRNQGSKQGSDSMLAAVLRYPDT